MIKQICEQPVISVNISDMKLYHQRVHCMSNRDQTRLQHMFDAVEAAIAHMDNRDREEL